MPKKLTDKKKAEVHEELEGFDISVDPFGKMTSNIRIEELNKFLNKNVEDKKLAHFKEEEE
jgi:methionyl-tRNA synthetase